MHQNTHQGIRKKGREKETLKVFEETMAEIFQI